MSSRVHLAIVIARSHSRRSSVCHQWRQNYNPMSRWTLRGRRWQDRDWILIELWLKFNQISAANDHDASYWNWVGLRLTPAMPRSEWDGDGALCTSHAMGRWTVGGQHRWDHDRIATELLSEFDRISAVNDHGTNGWNLYIYIYGLKNKMEPTY